MADYPNYPKISSMTMMAITILFVTIVVGFLFKKYLDRRKTPALSLAYAFLLWDFAAIAVLIFAILHYIYDPIPGLVGEIQYARYGINIGYAFSAMSNIMIVFFVSQIYAQSPLFRRTQKAIPIFNSILNGVTIGMITDAIMHSLRPELIDPLVKYNPQYPIGQTVYHLVLTVFAFLLLIILSARSRKQSLFKWEKAGFAFIMISGLSGLFVYVLFAFDLIIQFVPYFSTGYTIFQQIGWLCGVLMCIFGYAGYVMPQRLRNWYQAKEKEVTQNV
ncbi:MAG: hypothetical protein FK733_18235 [Asgard group archaeon]|nr:hypothetical protein [Asgard group archaeon]